VECRWFKPTFAGDTVHVLVEIQAKEPGKKPDRGTFILKRLAINQRGETVMESTSRIVLKTKPA